MRCPECGCAGYLLADGREVTEHDLLHLEHAPRKIERRQVHALTCTRRPRDASPPPR